MSNGTKQEFLKTMTPKFRASFPQVFNPKAVQEGQEPKYSISMLFDEEAQKSPEFKAMKELMMKAIKNKWGPDKKKWPKNLRNPFRDGTEKEFDGYGEGVVFVNASSKMKPGIVDQGRNAIISEEEFYAGCYARATVNVFAYDTMGNKGVAFGLNNLQKLAEGEPFSGRTKAEDDFDAVEGGDDDFGGSDDGDDFDFD